MLYNVNHRGIYTINQQKKKRNFLFRSDAMFEWYFIINSAIWMLILCHIRYYQLMRIYFATRIADVSRRS